MQMDAGSFVMNPDDWAGNIAVVGCGSIGSNLAMQLAGMGLSAKLNLVDFDVVETKNLANQQYVVEDVGKFKCLALAHHVQQKTGKKVMSTHKKKFEEVSAKFDAIFCCVDSMAARKIIFDRLSLTNRFYGDGRITARTVMALGFEGRNYQQRKEYQTTLYDDPPLEDRVQMGGCNRTSAAGPTAALSANLLAWLFIDHVNAQRLGSTSEVVSNECILDLSSWTWMSRKFARPED
jgi:hypothetical protein